MFKPTFRIRNNDTVYVTDKYLCNGHWMIKHEHAKLKAFSKFLNLKSGRYLAGVHQSDQVPNLDQLIPARDGYRLMSDKPKDVIWNPYHTGHINGYIYEVPEEEIGPDAEGKDCTLEALKIGVSIDYVLLLEGYHAFAKHPGHPILLLNGPTLNDDLVGVIMPMRCSQ